jgi:hypothetical protein
VSLVSKSSQFRVALKILFYVKLAPTHRIEREINCVKAPAEWRDYASQVFQHGIPEQLLAAVLEYHAVTHHDVRQIEIGIAAYAVHHDVGYNVEYGVAIN